MASVITRIVDAVRQKLQRNAEAREDARALEATRLYWGDDVALRLADLLRNIETKASGRVQVLSLAQFRTHIGDFWETYQSRILLIAETTIARMIGKGNTFIPQGEDAWLLLFPELDPQEARSRADEIAARIGEKLVGEQFSPDPPPPPLSVLLDGAGVLRADGSLDFDAFQNAIERARRPAPKVAPKPAAKGPVKPVAVPKPALDIVLRPAWSSETETIDTYALRALGAAGEDFIADPQTVFTAPVALELCAAAGNLLYLMDGRKMRGRLVLPLPFGMFFATAGEDLRKALLNIPQRLRLHHLRVDAVRIPPETPVADVATLREALRPLVREVGLQLEDVQAENPLLSLEHAVFVVDFSSQRGVDAQQFHESLSGVRLATRQRLAVTGLRSKGLVVAAMNLGCDEVGGPGLAVDQRQLPERLSVLPKRDFMSP